MRPHDVVFLFDVDNTLLDYDPAGLCQATPGGSWPVALRIARGWEAESLNPD